MIWSVGFTEATDVGLNFDIYQGSETYRDTIGDDRDLFYEEGHLTRPEATLVMGDAEGSSDGVLRILSQPTIAMESGYSPSDCADLILNRRRWGEEGQTLAEDPDGFKLQVNDARQAVGGDTSYWDALNQCRLYTSRISSKRKFGPGTRIQARINLSEVSRTGYIYLLRLTSPGAYDNNPATGVDMSLAEFGWGKFGEPSRVTRRSILNTALRFNYEEAPFDGFLSFLTDTSLVDQAAYRATQTWNANLISNRFQTEMVNQLPNPIDLMEGWYIFTLDWRDDRLDFYFQKDNIAAEPVKYLTVTQPEMISQSCDQELYLGNNVSQTFAETKTGTVWDYVRPEDADPAPLNIQSQAYPQGRAYRAYAPDSLQVDWVRAFSIPDGSAIVCP